MSSCSCSCHFGYVDGETRRFIVVACDNCKEKKCGWHEVKDWDIVQKNLNREFSMIERRLRVLEAFMLSKIPIQTDE